jgi:serine/threonine protein kinase
MALSAGTKLGPYEVRSSLGAGGMGEVYLARDTRLDRSVAVKVLPSAFSLDSDRLHRFEHEARCLGALNHPNLLAIYDIGSQDGVHYLVSELLEGESLRERLSEGPLPLRKVVDTAVQLAKGPSDLRLTRDSGGRMVLRRNGIEIGNSDSIRFCQ